MLEEKPKHIEVEEENWDTLLIFLALGTQWRKQYAGMDGTLVYLGLDYPGLEVVIRMNGFKGKKAREIFDGIQLMESVALPLLNKR